MLNVAPELVGVQTPRFSFAPESDLNSSPEVIALCERVGMPLDEWQQLALELMLGERADGLWSAFEFGLIVARQNGKGGVLEARELGGLFLFDERTIIHSAHEEGTAAEAYLRMFNLIDSTPFLSKRVKSMTGAPGKQKIILNSGQRLIYKTRTASGGRGYSGSPVIFDEAQKLTARQLAAIMPVASAQDNPQLIYAGTVLAEASTFRGLVERGRGKIGDRLGYAEWSAKDDADQDDPHTWADANPALGIRITVEYVRSERESFLAAGAAEEWAQERLSIWPDLAAIGTLIPVALWEANLDPVGTLPEDWANVSVGLAVAPGRDHASVGAAAGRDKGQYVEVVKDDPGIEWIVPYLVQLHTFRPFKEVLIDQMGPAATFIAPLVAAGIAVRVTDTGEYKKACATFVDGVKAGKIFHRGQPQLTEAAYGVKEHKVGDMYVYARHDSGVMVAPLESVTLARWGLSPIGKEFFVQNLNDL